MQSQREWRLPETPDPATVSRLREELQLTDLAARCLVSRGITDPGRAGTFLSPSLQELHDPALFTQMEKAVDRILKALEGGERILIHGDYDADGITSTALLLQFFDLLRVPVEWHIPNRLTEGFSFSPRIMRRVKEEKVDLIITVDNGINARTEVAELADLGCEVIITDHHEPGPELPAAAAVLDPKVEDSGYPFAGLAGVGVAFKLAWATARRLSGSVRVKPEFRRFLYEAVQLVALGTVADMVPLVDENRPLVALGLQAMGRSAPAGLEALKRSCNLAGRRLDTVDIAFRLAPRINAAGRIGRAELALELFRAREEGRREEIAAELEEANRERQRVEKEVLAQAERMLRERPDLAEGPVVFLAGRDWSPGVLGIVAARLCESRRRPVLLAALQDGVGRGSARSPEGFPIHRALSLAQDLLLAHGGHARAAGFKVAETRIEPLRERLYQAARQLQGAPPPLRVDAPAGLAGMTPEVVRDLQRLAPFGAANPRPLFTTAGLEVVGRPWNSGYGGRDLSFLVRQGQAVRQAVIKGKKGVGRELVERGRRVDLAFTPAMVWRGDEVELRVKELRLESAAPRREERVNS